MYANDTLTIEEFEKILKVMPDKVLKTVKGWMLSESASFVGNKKKDGSFTKYLLNKDRKYRGGKWSRNFARTFQGKLENDADLNRINVKMGISSEKEKKMPLIGALSRGASIRANSSPWLWIPNFENMKKAGINVNKYGSSGKNPITKVLADNNNKIEMFYYMGKMFAYLKTGNGVKHLIFTGVKSVTVKQQFDFYGQWEKRRRGLEGRLERRLKTMLSREKLA